jgi:hypothetical protein
MSGTKIKTLLKNLKTQNETSLETFQELPLTIQDDSYVTPVNLKVSLTADSVDLRPEDGGIGLGISASTISLGSSTTVVGSTLTATNISFTGNLEGLSQDTIESDGDITLIPGADSLVKILKESADGSAVGMLIRKPNQGSAVITMGESADGTEDHSYTNGFRLAYQGDGVTGETQGLDYNDMGAIQALDVTSVTDGGVTTYTQNIHNVMEWSRAGEDVKVSSKDDLKLEFKWRNNGYPYAQLDVDLSDKFVDVDPQTKYPILKSTVSGTEHNNFSTSSTSLRSYRDLILTVGMGFNDNTNLANESQSPPKISICKPTFTNLDISGEVEVASIDHTGKAAFSDVELSGSLTAFDILPRTDAGLRLGDDTTSNIVMSGEKVTIGGATQLQINGYIHPGVGADRILRIKRDDLTPSNVATDIINNTPLGVSIEKPTDGSCFLQVVERYINGDTDTVHGCRLASEGDGTNEDLGLQNNYSGLQAIDGPDVNNILSFYREGTDVKLESQTSLTITANGGAGSASTNPDTTDTSVIKLVGRVLFDVDKLSIDNTSGTLEKHYIGINPTTGELFNRTWGTGFFTGQHSYHSTEEIPTGACVNLVDGKVSLVTTANSKVCCGIVNQSSACAEESPISTSLQETISSGYVISVLSVGDSREADCQGFNVCNENGDIQPGDLLVTSNTPGYLMKQDDDIIRSCTVGKAMEQVSFDENGQATGVYGYLYCG